MKYLACYSICGLGIAVILLTSLYFMFLLRHPLKPINADMPNIASWVLTLDTVSGQ